NTRQEAAEGDAIPPASGAAPPADAAAKAARGLAASDQAQLSQNLSFLARDGVVLDNLRPDEQGAIRIPLDQLGEAVVLRVVVVDPVATVERTVVRPLPEVESRDLRLAQPLNPQTPFTLQRGVLVAG